MTSINFSVFIINAILHDTTVMLWEANVSLMIVINVVLLGVHAMETGSTIVVLLGVLCF